MVVFAQCVLQRKRLWMASSLKTYVHSVSEEGYVLQPGQPISQRVYVHQQTAKNLKIEDFLFQILLLNLFETTVCRRLKTP